MKHRAPLAVGLVIALAFPALALAQRRTYFGPAAGGTNNAGVELSARLTGGSPVRLKRFEWHNIPAACGGSGQTATTGEFPSAVAIKDGAFHRTATLNGGRTKVTIRGRFKHSNQRMTGTLRVRGTVAGCAAVDTGTVTWHAKQPAGQQ